MDCRLPPGAGRVWRTPMRFVAQSTAHRLSATKVSPKMGVTTENLLFPRCEVTPKPRMRDLIDFNRYWLPSSELSFRLLFWR